MRTRPKTFDAIAMKRRGAERVYQELASLDPAAQRTYWEQANRELQERQAALRQRQALQEETEDETPAH